MDTDEFVSEIRVHCSVKHNTVHVLLTWAAENRTKAANGAPRRRKAGGKYSETSGGEETAEDAVMTESDVPTSSPSAAGRRGAKAGGAKGSAKGGGNSGGESD